MLRLPKMLLARNSPLTIRWSYLPTLLSWLVRFARASTSENVHRVTEGLHSLMSSALDAHRELSVAANAMDMLKQTGWIEAWEKAPPVAFKERETLGALVS
ncbi:hypothetical protein SBC2_85370 (plasmid) [Caballeronia sp. SBC2]|nr:hypothetical protein SBC2_85370 [Caballeronia sp. SBC2]